LESQRNSRGAVLAPTLWLPATLAFGWYVPNLAHYNALDGSVGTNIGLLVWMIAAIALVGDSHNAAMRGTVLPFCASRILKRIRMPPAFDWDRDKAEFNCRTASGELRPSCGGVRGYSRSDFRRPGAPRPGDRAPLKMPGIDLGYGKTHSCLTMHECDELLDALSSKVVLRSRAGVRHLMTVPVVAALANSNQLLELARVWLGGSAVPFRATLFEKSRQTNWLIPWHQDTALPLANRFELDGWGPWSEKAGVTYAHAPASALARVVALRIHLDRSTADNGPLRGIPGSHTQGVMTDDDVLEYVATHEEVACVTERGGVVAMRPLVIHSSSKALSAEPRRVLHIEYADSLDFGDGIKLAVV
jgi:hypothetical protein